MLDAKVLPEKKIEEPVTGFLFFPMENAEDERPGTGLRRQGKSHTVEIQIVGRGLPLLNCERRQMARR